MLEPKLKGLAKSVMNLAFPDQQSYELFDNRVTFIDLAPHAQLPIEKEFFPTVSVRVRARENAEQATVQERSALQLWRPLLATIEYFERAEFKIKQAKFLNATEDDCETVLLFSGVARLKSGEAASIKSAQTARWKKLPDTEATAAPVKGQIYDWRTTSSQTIEARGTLFAAVTDQAIVSPEALAYARDSVHERLALAYIRDREHFKPPHKNYLLAVQLQHPGVAVVDIKGYHDLSLPCLQRQVT